MKRTTILLMALLIQQVRVFIYEVLERDDERSLCNIFVSEVRNGTFGEPERLPKNINYEELYTSTQPTVRATDNPNVEYIYFVSDRPGGQGGLEYGTHEEIEQDSIKHL